MPVRALLVSGFGALACALVVAGCGRSEEDPEYVPVYRSAQEARRGLDEAAELSLQPLKDFFRGDALGAPQKRALAEALKRVKGLVSYEPDAFHNYTAAGRILFVLGDYAEADRYLREAVRLAPAKPTGDWIDIVAETHYLLSRNLYATGQYAYAVDEAELALALAPINVDNLVARAQALLQVGKSEPARQDTERALELDPGNVAALRLKRLFDAASDER